MSLVGVKQHKHSSEKQLNPIIKIKYFKIPVNKDRERERNSYQIRSEAVMPPGLTSLRERERERERESEGEREGGRERRTRGEERWRRERRRV